MENNKLNEIINQLNENQTNSLSPAETKNETNEMLSTNNSNNSHQRSHTKFNSNRETSSQELALLKLKEKSLKSEKKNQQPNKKVMNYAQFL